MDPFELRIEHVVLVSLSKRLWQHDQTLFELIRIFTSYHLNFIEQQNSEDKLMEKLSKCAKNSLPKNLNPVILQKIEEKLLYIVKVMGKAIYSWLSESQLKVKEFDIINQNEAVELYLNNIIWDNVGMIDCSKTIRKMIDLKKFPNSYMEYVELCFNCLEEDIINWYQKTPIDEINDISNLIQQHYHERYSVEGVKSWDCDDFVLFAYWNLRYHRGSANFTTDELIDYFCSYYRHAGHRLPMPLQKLCINDQSVDANMFVFCTLSGKHSRLSYFLERTGKELELFSKYKFSSIDRTQQDYYPQFLRESFVFRMKDDLDNNYIILNWFMDKIHGKRSVPHGLFDSPWFNLSLDIYNFYKIQQIPRDYKYYTQLIKAGLIPQYYQKHLTKFFDDTFQEFPLTFSEVFNYSIAKQILVNRSFISYKNIIQHQVFEKRRFDIAVKYSIRYFGEIRKNSGDFIESFTSNCVQGVFTEDEELEFQNLLIAEIERESYSDAETVCCGEETHSEENDDEIV